jgi:hypothetical protein
LFFEAEKTQLVYKCLASRPYLPAAYKGRFVEREMRYREF